MQKFLLFVLLSLCLLQATSAQAPWLIREPSGAIYFVVGGTTARWIPGWATYYLISN